MGGCGPHDHTHDAPPRKGQEEEEERGQGAGVVGMDGGPGGQGGRQAHARCGPSIQPGGARALAVHVALLPPTGHRPGPAARAAGALAQGAGQLEDTGHAAPQMRLATKRPC